MFCQSVKSFISWKCQFCVVALVRMWTERLQQSSTNPPQTWQAASSAIPSLPTHKTQSVSPMLDTPCHSKRSQGAGDKRQTSFTRKKKLKIEPWRQLPEEKAGELMSSILKQISVKTNKPYSTSFGIFCTILLSISCKSYQGIGCLFSHK